MYVDATQQHPLHAAAAGGATWWLTGDARWGAAVGVGTLAWMLVFGHRLPRLPFASSPQAKQDGPSVIIPHDWRTIQ